MKLALLILSAIAGFLFVLWRTEARYAKRWRKLAEASQQDADGWRTISDGWRDLAFAMLDMELRRTRPVFAVTDVTDPANPKALKVRMN